MKKWIAIVICHKEGENRVLTSFLVLEAMNRFQAHKRMIEELPANPEYLDNTGNIRPHTVIDLRCIKPHEEEFYRAAFVEMVSELFQLDQPQVARNSA
ncbi:hypothetical protein [Deinococcus soli (ex Cha et al. 2016)]|uniref:hypothetical protein n=1 Tax=Deinococcus soli (ex Cha et al. 2016) TaxID=1309411 RepID=UPI00166CE5CA|nr:hypothetical protein [Deinococcus soli (ex Cha et al. 2016)]